MEEALANCKTLNCEPLIYKYELACCYAMKLDWATAASHFEALLTAEQFQVRPLCGLQLAGCYHMLGHPEKAVAVLQRVPSFVNKKSSVDPMMAGQAKRFIANGGHLMWFELLFIRRDLAKMEHYTAPLLAALEVAAARTRNGAALQPYVMDSNKNPKNLGNALKAGFFGFGKKLETLGGGAPAKKEEVDTAPDDRAAYLMLKGAILKSAEKGDEAIAAFKELIAMQDFIKEKWYVAYSFYELGESYYQKGQLKEAQEAMKKCSAMSGYDWEDPLKIRLRVTVDQLKKGGVLDDAVEEEIEDGASTTITTYASGSSSSSSSSSTPASATVSG